MLRMVIFLVIGPPLGMFSMFLIPFRGFDKLLLVGQMLPFLPFAYLLGGIPAFFTGAVDVWLATKLPLHTRVVTTAATGYFVTLLWFLLQVHTDPRMATMEAFSFALIGIIPAALCSLLAGVAVREHGT